MSNNASPLISKQTSEGISTQVSLEADRLAGLRIGSDTTASHPLSGDNTKLDLQAFQKFSAKTRESGFASSSAQKMSNWNGGRFAEVDAQKNGASCDARRPQVCIDLQKCDGTNIVNWLRMVQLHVSSRNYTEEEWMTELPYHLQGGALGLWWEVHERNAGDKTVTWASFRQELMDRFCPHSEIEVVSNLRRIKYKNDIRLYIQQFSETVMQGRRPSEEVLLSQFLFGLPADYYMALTEGGLKRYVTLSEAMCRAKDVFAPKEAAAMEYIERNPGQAQQLKHQATDPVILRALSKWLDSTSSNSNLNSSSQDRHRGPPPTVHDQRQHQPRRFRNDQRLPRYQQRSTEYSNIRYSERNRDIERLLCRKCSGRGHDEQQCPLNEEAHRRPGQSCRRCGGKEHWARECTTPRWFRLNSANYSKQQINCVIGDQVDHECRENDEA